ncbi:hypothetical protein V8E53_008207 [Lactarius tabidus]
MKFGKGKGKAKNERRDGYSHIPDESGSVPHESHEPVAQDATASGAQPGPSGQSRSRRLQEAEKLRARAHKKGEERNELRQKAQELGDSSPAKRLMKLAKNCWYAMKWFHQRASDLFYKVFNRNAKPGEVDLHGQYPHEAIGIAEKRIREHMSKGRETIRFITGRDESHLGVAQAKESTQQTAQRSCQLYRSI